MDFIKNLLKGDKRIWGIYLVLLLISGTIMFSATSTLAYRATEYFSPGISHLTHLVFGTIVVLVVHNLPARILRGLGLIGYPVMLVALVAVMATPQVNGASRQMMGFQPSELAKFVTISVVATLLSRGRQEDGSYDRNFYWTILGVSAVPCLLILKENFSTGVLLGAVIFFMMFLAKVEAKRLLTLLGGVAIVGTLFIGTLLLVPADKLPGRMPTWKARFERADDDLVNSKINDKNLQAQYGHMAVANGGFIGKFVGRSQIRDFLPQAYSDFIYAIIIEEGGLILGGFVMFLYLSLFGRVCTIYANCRPMYPRLLLIGVTLLTVFQALMSMAVGVGVFVTGQPLPLISRGGTSILMTCVYFGVILSVSRINGDDEESDFEAYQLMEANRALAQAQNEQSEVHETIEAEAEVVEAEMVEEPERYPY